MYIAGLHLSMPSPQVAEGLAVLTTADFFTFLLLRLKVPKVTTEGEGGLPMPEFAPRSLLNKFMFRIQSLALLLPPAVFCTAVALNNFQQPAWMLNLSFPDDIVPPEWKTPLRLVACLAAMSLRFPFGQIFNHTNEGLRMIGRLEKPKMIQTGPYAVVRHPVYSVMLLQQAFYSVMYWSYVPLASLGVLAGVFAIKMPIEENVAQGDDVIGNDYTEYMKRVPYRVIPYVW